MWDYCFFLRCMCCMVKVIGGLDCSICLLLSICIVRLWLLWLILCRVKWVLLLGVL